MVIVITALNQRQAKLVVIGRVKAGVAKNANLIHVVDCKAVNNDSDAG